MTSPLISFHQLTQAEEYLAYFKIPYDPKIVSVNRLHILKKFSDLMRQIDGDAVDIEADEAIFHQYREALKTAYTLFTTSTALEQKLFKVFQDPPTGVVMLSDIEIES